MPEKSGIISKPVTVFSCGSGNGFIYSIERICCFPELYARMLREGHRSGNHTQTHLNGWETSLPAYMADIAEAARYIESDLFRPPFGRISSSQAKQIRKVQNGTHSGVVMWDLLSGDFDESLSKENCLNNVLSHASPWSIIVFHETERALPRLKYTLPACLRFFAEKGYYFKSI